MKVEAVEQFHREEYLAFGGGTEVADVDHVFVANTRRGARLLHEALDEIRFACEFTVQHFERDLFLEERVGGHIDRAHAAFA